MEIMLVLLSFYFKRLLFSILHSAFLKIFLSDIISKTLNELYAMSIMSNWHTSLNNF